ncbi:cell wall-associated NlpC family hydrolase [Arcanobacterium wilhelmae]|uniref:Cell wall-associated NlpC family hydrolase n=1 Tax=Arcanobacterium wilhelmae TaxID=1803177 RepID=A0ABT9NCD6_9ACTO|nr:C40 family peptidase [Arcanobacterium wilhelmae]MDP9801168.1 cell wall-associated NlpC family hydrolase [Arcanobacterium wilhelmae]WFN90520.1 NlpC/P60 family protein [Arcanobacterium wilhelmae]
MAKHAMAPEHGTVTRYGVAGAALASVAGVFVGMSSPAAADTHTDAAKRAVVPTTVEVATAQAASTVKVETAEVGKWEIAKVDFDAKAAPEPVADQPEQSAPEAENQAPAPRAQQSRATQRNDAAPANKAKAAAPRVVGSGNSAVVSIARQYSGAPYRSGGATPAGWDCSGFTSYVFAQAGIHLPRTSGAQRSAGTVIPASQARPGDLVWWPGHVGIYTGNGQHIAARNPAAGTYEGPVYGNPTYVRVG